MGDNPATNSSTRSSPFPNFNQLAPATWYYQPPHSSANPTLQHPQQPDLIILSTWMGAAPKHILKYTKTYQTLYPSTPLLLLTTGIKDIVFRPSSHHEKHLGAAVSVLRTTSQQNPRARISCHLFSNGGAYMVCQLAKLYRKGCDRPLPLRGIVLDSAPGRATYKRSIAAMSVGLPTFPPFRFLGLLLLHLACVAMWLHRHVFGGENVITRVRRELNDPLLFPREAGRVYIFSREDEMVDWETVEEHAGVAEAGGVRVERERFLGSGHVGHVRVDSERYWDAVGRVVCGS